MVLYDFFSDILTVILPFLLVLLSLSFFSVGAGSVILVYLLKEPVPKVTDGGVCFYFSDVCSDFYYFFPSARFGFGLFLFYKKKKMRCNIKPFSCFRFDFLMHALRAINFPPMTAFNVFQRVFCFVLFCILIFI